MNPNSQSASAEGGSPRVVAGTFGRRAGPLLLLLTVVLAVVGGLQTDRFQTLPDPLRAATGLRWWLTPVERNAFMRIPTIQGTLHGIHALSADVVWAVGNDGLIVGTTDGGRTWKRGTIVPGAPAPQPPKAAFVSPGEHKTSWSLIRSANAAVVRPQAPTLSVDGAQQYDPKQAANAAQSPVQTPLNVQQFNPAPTKLRAPVDTKGSSPEGASNVAREVRQKAPAQPSKAAEAAADAVVNAVMSNEVLGVRLLTPTIGVAITASGNILRTDDGGVTWHTARTATAQLAAVTATPGGRLVAVGASGTMLTSDDQGITWSLRNVKTRASLSSVAFADALTGLAPGTDGALFRTTDGGNTWSEFAATGSGPALRDVVFADGKVAIALNANAVMRSADGGATWARTSLIAADLRSEFPKAVQFFDSQHGLILGRDKNWTTADGGVTWASVASPCSEPSFCAALSAAPDGTMYVVGSDGLIARANDYGARWTPLTADATSTFRSLAFTGTRDGVIVGDHGTVLTTSDGGETWVARNTGVSAPLKSVGFASSDHGVAVGSGGTVLLTRDRGNSWAARPAGRSDYDVVDFSDARNGFAIARSNASEVATTADGGETWNLTNDLKSLLSDARYRSLSPLVASEGSTIIPVIRGSERGHARVTTQGNIEFIRGDNQPVQSFPIDRALPWTSITRAAFGDATHGIAIGRNGMALRTEDGGKQWQRASLDTTLNLIDLSFFSPHEAVVIASGRVFTSDDAGKTWSRVIYRRYPSPWLWLASFALLLAASLLIKQRVSEPEVASQRPSVADAAVSDSPITWKDPDAVGLRSIALGLSRFLRNRRTQPPITIAVTGEWGTGKSSLMNLLQEDLKRYGFRPVWFNAWHHQSGENLLGSLLANIHAQGVPPWMTIAGLDFRLSLLFVRIRRFWFRLALTLLALTVVFFTYEMLGKNAATLWSAVKSDGSFSLDNLGAATGLVGLVVAVLTPVLGAIRAVSAFGLQPQKLIANVATSGQDESSRLQPGARYRFAKEFRDFANALEPRTLVVFIDDLDRCRKENVIEVLEAVNFLVSSGRCVVVLGMARRWVEACVGKAFEELAAATAVRPDVAAPGSNPSAGAAAVAPLDEKQERALEQRQFARNYLEKLINIEIRIPRLTDEASRIILESSTTRPKEPGWRRRLGEGVFRAMPMVVLALSLGAIVLLGYLVADELKSLDSALAAREAATAHHATQITSSAVDVANQNASTQPNGSIPMRAERVLTFDAAPATSSMIGYVGTGVPALVTLAILAGLLLFMRKEVRTDDSPRFLRALTILQPLIVLGGDSPRSLKRFLNHLRYVAMRCSPIADPPTSWERLRNWVLRLFDDADSSPPAPESQRQPRAVLEENVLVALAAIYRINDAWLDILSYGGGDGSRTVGQRIGDLIDKEFEARIPDGHERALIAKRVQKAIDTFNAEFPTSALFTEKWRDAAYLATFYDVMARESASSEAPSE
jgi:photosystem II stability/assembly factor-like uncharacterized protein